MIGDTNKAASVILSRCCFSGFNGRHIVFTGIISLSVATFQNLPRSERASLWSLRYTLGFSVNKPFTTDNESFR